MHLVKRKSKWYFNLRIPKDVIHLTGYREIRISLHTSIKKDAKLLAVSLYQRINTIFTLTRCGMITQDQAIELLKLFREFLLQDHKRQLEELDEQPSLKDLLPTVDKHTGKSIEPPYITEAYQGYDYLISEYGDDIESGDYSKVAPLLDKLLKLKRYDLDKSELVYQVLSRDAMHECIEVFKELMTNIEAKYHTSSIITHKHKQYDNQNFSGRKQTLSSAGGVHTECSQRENPHFSTFQQPVENKEKVYLLSDAIKDFLTHLEKDVQVASSTVGDYRSVLKVLVNVLGDIDIKQVHYDSRKKFLDVLHQIPKHMNLEKGRFKGLSIFEVIESIKGKPDAFLLSDSSKKKYTNRCSSFFKWCVDSQIATSNFFGNIKMNVKEIVKDRVPFTIEELKRFFTSPIYKKHPPLKYAHDFFIPLIALFTGMRLNEICQLHTEDIQEIKGYWCILINTDGETKRLKTKKAKRIVPLHPVLIDLGLLDYLKFIKEVNLPRLWMALEYKNKKYYKDYSRFFNKYLDEYVTDSSSKDFHSFRSTFINWFKQRKGDEASVAALVGQGHDSITYSVYGGDFEPKSLYETIESIAYDIDFSNLKYTPSRPSSNTDKTAETKKYKTKKLPKHSSLVEKKKKKQKNKNK